MRIYIYIYIGAFNCDDSIDGLVSAGFTSDDASMVKAYAFEGLKKAYRYDYLSCPDSCDDEDDCRCSCSFDASSASDDEISTYASVLLTPIPTSAYSADVLRSAVSVVCLNTHTCIAWDVPLLPIYIHRYTPYPLS